MHWSLKQTSKFSTGAPENAIKTKASDDHKHYTMQPFDTAFGGAQGGGRVLNGAAHLPPLEPPCVLGSGILLNILLRAIG